MAAMPRLASARHVVWFGQATGIAETAVDFHDDTLTDPLFGLRSAVFAVMPSGAKPVITHFAEEHPTEYASMPETLVAARGITLADAGVIPSTKSVAVAAPATAISI